ncbi:MAG: NAD(P)/FAD-dependent oxidoreductase [Anaerolineae bacterium]|uniref:NAD(P)/FAD-dependent oxidoreductase n=1 Tax=Candidatus Desulfolinea nitratireducens TaxID=2841698 RepID=A0A8J6TFY4_9CHLR|nr:NAD(P)/FAD-dependent oxidoreductase [Candidatus Desulfolinea nitratireducens]MBL6960337.1 NAD(P)/FAD-dependent oxidoreductase [Anaerolineales bacterium]NQU29565.1 NAD(P)/FAD-dependent oxidoreductase [Anaerolineae bacterium]
MHKIRVIIIGAGPAGLTTALQLKRFGIPALVLEGREIGGLLHNANLVENYPGFPQGVTGPKLVNLLKKQVERIGVEILPEKAQNVEYDSGSFVAKTDQDEYRAEIAVIASGTKARQFDNGFIPANAKSRVFYEVRDLLEITDKEIIIVGAGDAAFDYALNLGQRNQVKILNRGRGIKALGLLVERSQQNENIAYLEDAQLKEVTVSENECLTVKVVHREKLEILEADYLIGALGREPNLDFLGECIQKTERKLVDSGILYFIGDVRNGIYRQTAIAAGDGLRAAMQIDQRFKENR